MGENEELEQQQQKCCFCYGFAATSLRGVYLFWLSFPTSNYKQCKIKTKETQDWKNIYNKSNYTYIQWKLQTYRRSKLHLTEKKRQKEKVRERERRRRKTSQQLQKKAFHKFKKKKKDFVCFVRSCMELNKNWKQHRKSAWLENEKEREPGQKKKKETQTTG